MNSIRRQLLIGLVVGSVVLLGLAGAALYQRTEAILRAEFDAALRARALALVSQVKEIPEGVEFDYAHDILPKVVERDQSEYFQLREVDGSTLERSRSLAGKDLPQRAGTLEHPAFWDLPLPDGRAGRAISMEFVPPRDPEDWETNEDNGVKKDEETTEDKDSTEDEEAIDDKETKETIEKEGITKKPQRPPDLPVTFVLAQERMGLDRTLAEFRTTLFVIGLIFVAATALLVIAVAKKGLAPLARVADQAAAIDISSLEVRFPTDSMPQELRPICDRLNDLLARLEEAFQRERRFGANIAHELRTPIAELRALAEVALKWPEDGGSNVAFQDALAVAQRMETIVAGLLTLARYEDGKQAVTLTQVKVNELVEEVWSPLAERAGRKKLAVATEIPHALCLKTDRSLLRLILSNLLANAVDYAPTGGRLSIAASSRNGLFDLTVANATEALSPQDLPHLFERFWRKDAARTDSTHVGLGLSLARVSADVLGMTLSAEMPDRTTLRLVLSGSHAPAD